MPLAIGGTSASRCSYAVEQPTWCADGFKALRTALATLPLQQKRSCHKLALLVPYRNRPQHLEDFLPRMHAYLTVRPPC